MYFVIVMYKHAYTRTHSSTFGHRSHFYYFSSFCIFLITKVPFFAFTFKMVAIFVSLHIMWANLVGPLSTLKFHKVAGATADGQSVLVSNLIREKYIM